MKTTLFRPAIAFMLVLGLVTGIIYPLAVTGLAQFFFPFQTNGSLVEINGQVVGSTLIGQEFHSPQYFWPRPSAIDYDPMPSSGSNLGPISHQLAGQVQQRAQAAYPADGLPAASTLPSDLLFASGSGLDPHISPEAARLQIDRVAQTRNFPIEQVAALVEKYVEPRQLGLLGEPRVNILLLNIALDGLK
jgi:K+-transporting ATPase ATPase C chain